MTSLDSYGDYTKELDEPIKIRLTGTLRKELYLDYEGTAEGTHFGEDLFDDDPMMQIFDEYKTYIVVRTEGQAADLLHKLDTSVVSAFGRNTYANSQVKKAGLRVQKELAEALLDQGHFDMVDQYGDQVERKVTEIRNRMIEIRKEKGSEE